MFQINKVKKQYYDNNQSITPFDSLSFSIEESSFFSISGVSGTGKSTLLNLISGLDRPGAGQIFYMNTPIHSLDKKHLSMMRLNSFGFIFQTPHFLPQKTVLENVLLPANYARVSDYRLFLKRANEVLEYVGLNKFSNRTPATLSGGELQRMVFARALLMDPEVIFADEPTASLDLINANRILSLLNEQKEKGKTIIMVSHDPVALSYADTTLNLEKNNA